MTVLGQAPNVLWVPWVMLWPRLNPMPNGAAIVSGSAPQTLARAGSGLSSSSWHLPITPVGENDPTKTGKSEGEIFGILNSGGGAASESKRAGAVSAPSSHPDA